MNTLLKAVICTLTTWGLAPNFSTATTIDEVLVPPSTPGNSYTGTFFITPSQATWAFGVANDAIEDTSVSGISSIDGLEANDHWVSAIIARSDWDNGFNFDSIRPIGATPPSSFSIDTTNVLWQWGATSSVAFYWLSEAGPDANNPLAVLQAGTEYDAFRFFTSDPNSPFASFSAPNGGDITTGETVVSIVPEPSAVAMISLFFVSLSFRREHREGERFPMCKVRWP
ncbi:hypothetical protein [Bythopirellula goksoeyrii]|uniref:PEP-CTERM protein-sorting domain-containing protein n=1 Tax=Bythopirellula goksoeyrii TaxID=1400387 RepID=A0A5B9QA08_9BACT|nr:hypothetical protein [Bythopirellula goksoeyrii]QEG34455.1 hypothetical protein Pr1d_17350 [Bythopirellula goksoeyrii]